MDGGVWCIEKKTRARQFARTKHTILTSISINLHPLHHDLDFQTRANHDPPAALVRLAEPVALTSIFPYAWKLVLHYEVTDERNAAFYAGILISAFALAEACTGMYWGGLSDRVGRKPVLLFGCAGTLLSLLVLGFAPNFWVALAGRALGGVLNGNIGVIQTMVGELVQKPEHERMSSPPT